MRKFILEKVGSSGGLERTTTCSLNGLSAVITPSIWILTKSGAIPTLTPETVEMGGLSADSEMFAGLLVPLQDLIKSADVFQSYQKGEILLSIKFRKFSLDNQPVQKVILILDLLGYYKFVNNQISPHLILTKTNFTNFRPL